MIVAFTGHRPDKLERPVNRINEVLGAIQGVLLKLKPDLVITGGALGVDQLAAGWARALHIPYRIYEPFPGFSERWTDRQHDLYERLCEDAAEVRVISPSYNGVWVYQTRNVAMVDDCDVLASVWDGSSGGTANCNAYARKVNRETIQLWPGR